MIKKLTFKDIIISAFISIFAICFGRGFWSRGIYAFGINYSIFWLLFLGLFFFRIENFKKYFFENYYWIVSIIFLILSFSLYENPFLKIINIFVIPICLLLFIGLSITEFKTKINLNIWLLTTILKRKLDLLEFKNTIKGFLGQYVDNGKLSKIILGVVIFLSLDVIIIVLLSGADKNFAIFVENMFSMINFEIFVKIFFMGIFFVFIVLLNLNWEKKYIVEGQQEEKQLDSIVSGIVISGVFSTYLLFIIVKFSSLSSNALPLNMDEIGVFVKSGFWQLFAISIINIAMLFIYYKKTIKPIQNILFGFVFASIFLLYSASSKMYLYIINFGFSYEKFFASYVVIFFAVLFLMFLYFIFFNSKTDILKSTLILAFLMYGFINIIPSEKLMFETNLLIGKNTYSKMQRYQSHIFSIDILSSVEKLKGTPEYSEYYWNEWTDKKVKKYLEKKWYERNINYFFYYNIYL